MWGAVAGIAGKGAGLAGQGISRAVDAASYVGEVIAPVSEQGELEEAVACPLSPPGGERQQHQQERRQRERQEDIVVQSMIPERRVTPVSSPKYLRSGTGVREHSLAGGSPNVCDDGNQRLFQAKSTSTSFAEESPSTCLDRAGHDDCGTMYPETIANEEGNITFASAIAPPVSGAGGVPTTEDCAQEAGHTIASIGEQDDADHDHGQLEQPASPLLRQEVATLQRCLQAREHENEQTRRRLALAEEEISNKACALRVEELEVEVRCLSEELQEAKLRESELGAELHEQCHVNTQLKQVIDQMREVSRTYGEESAGRARGLEEAIATTPTKYNDLDATEKNQALKAKEAAEQEAASFKMRHSEVQAELEQALQGSDQRNSSDREKATLSKRLRQAQARIDEVLAEKQRSEQGLVVKLTSSQRLYQAAFQREQQLSSQVKALTADLALANQDKAHHQEALGNLRGVLEEFHAERQTEVAIMEQRLKEELALQATTFDDIKTAMKNSHERQLSEQAQSMAHEHEKLKARHAEAVLEGENARIKEDLIKNRAALEDALLRLSGDCVETLDRQLVTNLIVRYVTSRHKRQVLELMARMFNFSEEEKEQVGLTKNGRSLPGMVTAMLLPTGQDSDKVYSGLDRVAGSSLSDLWMDFLITETTDQSR